MILNKVRTCVVKYKLSLVIGSATLFASCTKDKMAADIMKKNVHTISRTGNSFSGEEIFKGLFFKEGDVVDALPALNADAYFKTPVTLTDDQLAQKQDIMADMITTINSIQPDFFEHFEAEIKSDDYDRINTALNDAASMLTSAGLKSVKYGDAFKAAYQVSADTDFSQFDLNTPEGRAEFMSYINNQAEMMVQNGDQFVAAAAVVVAAFLVWEAAMFANAAVVATVAVVDVAIFVHIAKTKTRGAMVQGQPGEYYRDQLVSELAVNIP